MMKADHPLRILFVEDLPSDTELAERELRKGGISFRSMRVETKKEFLHALKDFHPDLIISDYAMPEFDGMQALKLSLKYDEDLPFILFTGSMNEETAVACMKAGAMDYIIKEHIRRLPVAVMGALERKRARLAGKESEKEYRELFESIMDVFYRTDNEGVVLIVSPSVEKLLGYAPDEVIGGKTVELYIHPEEWHQFISVLRKEKEVKGFESALRAKDGSTVWVSTHAQFYRDEQGKVLGVQGILHDVTERKQAAEALRESEQKYRNLFENANEAIYVAQDGWLVFVNPMSFAVMGYSGEELLLRPFIEFVHPDDRDMVLDNHIKRTKGEEVPHRHPFRIIHKDGNIRWVEMDAVLIQWNGKAATLNFMSDITERNLAEEQLQHTLESLRNAVRTTIQVIVSTVEARDPYTANHQIRSADLARAIATEMKLSPDRIEGIRIAGSIHDLGKLSIPAEILSKPGKLTKTEFSLIKEHSRKGYDILKNVESSWPLAEIVYQHHERMDGSGYPRNLKGDAILMEARILAVCDVVESMASHRPYRAALGIDAALKEIKDNRGILYDADVVDACMRLFNKKEYKFE